MTPCRRCAEAIRASSCVSVSSLLSPSSISFLPRNFFIIFPEQYSVSDVFELRLLTRRALFNLHRRNRENREDLNHYTKGYIDHLHGQRCPELGSEAFEKLSDALKKFKKKI
jgi:hypothetical protein